MTGNRPTIPILAAARRWSLAVWLIAASLHAREAVVGMDERVFKIVSQAQERLDRRTIWTAALRILEKAERASDVLL